MLRADVEVEEADWAEVVANRVCLRRGARTERVSALVAVLEASILIGFWLRMRENLKE